MPSLENRLSSRRSLTRVRLRLQSMCSSVSKLERWLGLQSGRLLVPVGCFILIGMLILMSMSSDEEASFEPEIREPNSLENFQLDDPGLSVINGTEVMWQMPEAPKAVLFLAHGCHGRATNFWAKSASCPSCVGLPEERKVVLEAVDRGYAVLVISSAGKCWTFEREVLVIKNIILWWVSKYNLESLPLVALGASSGGYFVSKLALVLKFSSISLMISEGLFDQLHISNIYPPTLFVHMPKDAFRTMKISAYVDLLKNKGIDSAEVQCHEIPLTETFLSDRIQEIEETLSIKLFKLFRDKGFINGSGYMIKDGRVTRWREALRLQKNLQLDDKLFQHVEEELNLAFGYHEMSSINMEKIFHWFESHIN